MQRMLHPQFRQQHAGPVAPGDRRPERGKSRPRARGLDIRPLAGEGQIEYIYRRVPGKRGNEHERPRIRNVRRKEARPC